jgi:hypothetical protein
MRRAAGIPNYWSSKPFLRIVLEHPVNARSTTLRLLGPAAALSAVLLAAGCGGSSSASSKTSPSAGGGSGSRQAFEDCLKKNGVTLPSGSPRQGGGQGGGFGGQSMSPEQQKAFQACRSLAPKGGGRGGGGFNSNELAAFRTCMQNHGVTIPSRSPGSSPSPGASPRPGGGGGGALRGLNTADPKVAAALKICRPLLPTRSASPQPST